MSGWPESLWQGRMFYSHCQEKFSLYQKLDNDGQLSNYLTCYQDCVILGQQLPKGHTTFVLRLTETEKTKSSG